MYKAILEDIKQTVLSMDSLPNVRILNDVETANTAHDFGVQTNLGNYNYASASKNLSTALTVYLGSFKVESGFLTQKKRDIKKSAPETIRLVHEYLKKAPISSFKLKMGDDSDFTPSCNIYLSTYHKDSIRLAHMISQTLFPDQPDNDSPELSVVMIPEWQEKDRQILVFPEIGVTYILGTDYFGEVKNAFLRMAMWSAKQRDMLGLHAGTKTMQTRGADGRLRNLGMIMFGIAATGKTTHACHDHNLDADGECVKIVQDDMVFWRKDGSALGCERGFYIKTENLNLENQPLLYDAALCKDAILENVMTDYKGNVWFEDRTLTANGHAIIQRKDLGSQAAPSINLPPIDELDGLVIAFMVRNYTVVPMVSRLTPEQAAVAFILSESIDAAGGDIQKSENGARGISANPFVIGDASDDVHRFYEMVKSHGDKIECYMLNTGGAGELVEHGLDGGRKVRRKVSRIEIQEMAAIIRGLGRKTIRWREDPNWMVETPEYVEGLDIRKFDPSNHYNQLKIDSLIASIRLERAQYAEQFKNLNPLIKNAVEF